MKFSYDLDGTALEYIELFKAIVFALKQQGHIVGILTGHQADAAESDNAKMISLGFPLPDFHFGRTPDFMHLNGAHFKSMIIVRESIDLHFDDYDYNNADTIRLFAELGQEHKIARIKSQHQL